MIFFLLILIFLPVSEVKFLFTTYQNISMHVVLLSENYKWIQPCVLKTPPVSLLLTRARKNLLLLLDRNCDICTL